MSTILLRLAAPLQSWGVESKFVYRSTGYEPSKSGVLGMIASAMGISRDDDVALSRLAEMKFGVRVDQQGNLLDDYQTVQAKQPYVVHRYYLEDAVFIAGIESNDEKLVNEIAYAMQHPRYPLFLGRRSCPPTLPVFLGIRSATLEAALNDEPWAASDKMKEKSNDAVLPVIMDADFTPGCELRMDHPVSFSWKHRKHQYRSVSRDKQVHVSCASGSGEHDPMQELR